MSGNLNDLLGQRARDQVTGWIGIITGTGHHLTGCDTVGIVSEDPKIDNEKNCRWFDVTRIEIIDSDPESTRTLRGLRRAKRKDIPSAG
jgi:hypothetical protein